LYRSWRSIFPERKRRVDWAKQVDWFKSQKAGKQLGWKAIKKCCEELKIEEVRMRSGEVPGC